VGGHDAPTITEIVSASAEAPLQDDRERLPLRGPAAVVQRVIDERAKCKEILRAATEAADREQIKRVIAVLDLALRKLRRKRTAPPRLYYEIDNLTDRERVMAQLAKKIGRGRDVIYHGTRRLPHVLRAGKLVPPMTGECGVFFTRSAEVAAYFGCLLGDESERRSPGVLVLDRSLLTQCYRIEPSRYDEFSPRDEREEVIWRRTVNFRRHLLGAVSETNVNAVLGPPKQRYLPRNFIHWPSARRRKFQEKRRAAGYRFVRTGRARVRELIVKEREVRLTPVRANSGPKSIRRVSKVKR
jgi:hypothetical protein